LKILITQNTVAGGEVVTAGDALVLDDKEAKYLIAIRKAVEYKEPKAPEPAPVVENKEDDLDVQDRDPKPSKRRGRPKKKAKK
jgi:hypothetical protein